MDALALSILLSMSCQQYSEDMLYPLAVYANSRVVAPAMGYSAEVLDEDIRWVCERYPDKTVGWILDQIQHSGSNNQEHDAYTVFYQYWR